MHASNNRRHHLGCKEPRDLRITARSEYSHGLGKTVTRHLRPQNNNYVLTRLLKRFTEARTRHTNHTRQFSVDAKEKESGYFGVGKRVLPTAFRTEERVKCYLRVRES